MADLKISQLNPPGSLDGSEIVPAAKAGNTVGPTITQIKNFVVGSITGLTDGNKGDITVSGSGSSWNINANSVARGDLTSTSGPVVLGSTAAGAVSDLTGSQVTALLDTFTSGAKGLVPPSGGGTANFLRADGTFAAPPSGGGGGTVTNALTLSAGGTGAAAGSTFDGSVARTISYNSIGAVPAGLLTASGLTMNTARFLGRTSASVGAVEELTAAAFKAALGIASTDVSGLATVATSGSASDLSAGTLSASRLPAHTGDATSSAGSANLTLATVNANTGVFGSASAVPIVTVNSKGLITAMSTAALGTAATKNLAVGTSAPGSPATNDLWVDTN